MSRKTLTRTRATACGVARDRPARRRRQPPPPPPSPRPATPPSTAPRSRTRSFVVTRERPHWARPSSSSATPRSRWTPRRRRRPRPRSRWPCPPRSRAAATGRRRHRPRASSRPPTSTAPCPSSPRSSRTRRRCCGQAGTDLGGRRRAPSPGAGFTGLTEITVGKAKATLDDPADGPPSQGRVQPLSDTAVSLSCRSATPLDTFDDRWQQRHGDRPAPRTRAADRARKGRQARLQGAPTVTTPTDR